MLVIKLFWFPLTSTVCTKHTEAFLIYLLHLCCTEERKSCSFGITVMTEFTFFKCTNNTLKSSACVFFISAPSLSFSLHSPVLVESHMCVSLGSTVRRWPPLSTVLRSAAAGLAALGSRRPRHEQTHTDRLSNRDKLAMSVLAGTVRHRAVDW